MYRSRSSRRRGRVSVLLVVASCLGGYVALASTFNWFVAPTAAKHQPVLATVPTTEPTRAPVPAPDVRPASVEPAPPAAAPVRPAGAVPPAPATPSQRADRTAPTTQLPTAQFDFPSRFVAQPRPLALPPPSDPRLKARASATPAAPTAAATPEAAPRRPVRRQVARPAQPSYRWDSWSFAGGGGFGYGRW